MLLSKKLLLPLLALLLGVLQGVPLTIMGDGSGTGIATPGLDFRLALGHDGGAVTELLLFFEGLVDKLVTPLVFFFALCNGGMGERGGLNGFELG